jgi:hypothetical protein
MKKEYTRSHQDGDAPKQKWHAPLLIVFDTIYTKSGQKPSYNETQIACSGSKS